MKTEVVITCQYCSQELARFSTEQPSLTLRSAMVYCQNKSCLDHGYFQHAEIAQRLYALRDGRPFTSIHKDEFGTVKIFFDGAEQKIEEKEYVY